MRLTSLKTRRILLPAMRTFIEGRLFGTGDRIVTWVWMAGMAWLIVAICYAAVGLGLILTIWLFPLTRLAVPAQQIFRSRSVSFFQWTGPTAFCPGGLD